MTAKLTRPVLDDLRRSGLNARDAAAMRLRPLSAAEMYRDHKVSVEAYAIPYHRLDGRVNGFERRRFVGAALGLDKLRRDLRYRQNKKGCRLYLPPAPGVRWVLIAKDAKLRLQFTEGEKKAYAATKAGFPTVGLGGVENWRRQALAQLDAFDLDGRECVIVFDSPDVDANPNVRRALREFAAELERRGATVGAKRLPLVDGAAQTKLDDFLVACGAKAFGALPVEPIEPPQHNTDTGNARRLVARHGADLRYSAAHGWLVWGNGRWYASQTEVMRRAKDTAGSIYGEAAREKDDARRAALAKWAATSESALKLEAAIKLARSEPGVEVDVKQFDADPWLLSVENGVLDLRMGKLRAARRDDLITRRAPVAFDPRARCPIWDACLRCWLAGDAALSAYIRRAVGYTLTGDTMQKTFWFLYGPTDGGKSTFVETVMALLGPDYSRKVTADVLMRKSFTNPSGATPELFALIGKRLIVASELSDRQQFDEAFLKNMSGGIDQMDARGLYQKDPVNFKPVLKTWLYGNHRPQLRFDDDAVWRRAHLVPFEVRIPRAEQDDRLPEKLRAELPGILNWALAGLRDFQRRGLCPPAKVAAATAQYRKDQDWLGPFLEEELVEDAAKSVPLQGAYDLYRSWAKESNVRPASKPTFQKMLRERGFAVKAAGRNVVKVFGLRLKMTED